MATLTAWGHHNKHMSLFDKTVEFLNRWFAANPSASTLDEEQAHLDLLQESSGRIASTMRAIQEGNLIAALSATENKRVAKEMRFASTRNTRVGAVSSNPAIHSTKLAENRAFKSNGERSL